MQRFIVLGILIAAIAGCQPATLQERETKDILEFPGMTKNQIFVKSINWLAENFRSSKSVIELQDKEQGKIVGNIVTSEVIFISTFQYESKMIIDIKDSRVRITYVPEMVVIDGNRRPFYGNEVNNAKKTLQDITRSYRQYMTQEKSDW